MKLQEKVAWSNPKIDKESGIVHGVKVLGFVSSNGRRYKREALERALPLYENVGVNIDHEDANKRRVKDGFGRLSNVRLAEDGVYGDVSYLKAHDFASTFVEAAERMPELLGMSHVADGKLSRDNGEELVEDIVTVESVDIVRRPATTKSLFESEEQQVAEEKKIKEVKEEPSLEPWRKSLSDLVMDGKLTEEQVTEKLREMVQPPAPQTEPPKEDDRVQQLEEQIKSLQHELSFFGCVQSHQLDIQRLTDEQATALREAKDRTEMDKLAESLPRIARMAERPAMRTKTTGSYQQLREELERTYQFK